MFPTYLVWKKILKNKTNLGGVAITFDSQVITICIPSVSNCGVRHADPLTVTCTPHSSATRSGHCSRKHSGLRPTYTPRKLTGPLRLEATAGRGKQQRMG